MITMDKLVGFPPLYYINLHHREDRNDYMKGVVHRYNLDGTRISATNGACGIEYLSSLVDEMPQRLRPNEIACTISHLRAIQHWLNTSQSDTAMICEDDVCLDSVTSWNHSWNNVVSSLPYYWEILQCCVIFHPQHDIIINLHHRTSYDYSAACYMIRRSYAERLMNFYWNQETKRWRLSYPTAFPLTSEEVIYRPGVCLTIPLFSFTNEHGSDIQTKDHIETYHSFSKKIHQHLWKELERNQQVTILSMHPLLTYNV